MAKGRFAQCNGSSRSCVYDLNYGNGDSATSSDAIGYYLSDVVHLDGISQHIVFG
jgi:hypothetical protein